jgi:peptide/nickel transport system substrate-binding protein
MKEFHIRGSDKLLGIIKSFSATEKVIFGILTVVALISALALAWGVNRAFLISIPAHGGRLAEGVVGLPRSINPVLAFTDVDLDLSNLVFSGLMKYEGGKLVPDLAQKYTVSDDGLTYDFILKPELRFHDGVPLTADDVEFTVQKVQDSIIKSPRRADWANIVTKVVSPTEIQFILKQPYAPFLSNTTLGIIPKHIWSKISPDQFIYSQYNVEPIGSGPYQLKSIQRDSGGIPIDYAFGSFSRYHNGEPYIADLLIYFYPNEKTLIEAYGKGVIESMARISANEAVKIASTTPQAKVLHTPLPRIFGIFFNQNQAPIFLQKEVRQALNAATDKDEIIQKVLSGYGIPGDGPVPAEASGPLGNFVKGLRGAATSSDYISKAQDILNKAGWVMNANGVMEKRDKKGTTVQTLEFSIATADAPDLKLAADLIKSQWEKIGAKVTIKVFDYGDLYQNIIATRKYDALLFGESIGKDLDLYAFWHSSQRNSPGLNVAMYVNSKADKLLDDARVASDPATRDGLYDQFEKIIQDEVPAVFLYSPEFIYVVPEKSQGMKLEYITSPSDRFYGINKWYITTDSVWKIFGRQTINNIINYQITNNIMNEKQPEKSVEKAPAARPAPRGDRPQSAFRSGGRKSFGGGGGRDRGRSPAPRPETQQHKKVEDTVPPSCS